MLWNFKDFSLTESMLMWLSTKLNRGTSSSLCVSCICLGCLGASPVCACLLELWFTALKWLSLPHMLHILLNTRHCFYMYTAPQHLQSSDFNYSLFSSPVCCLSTILTFLPLCMLSKSFMFFISSNSFAPSMPPLFGPTLVPVYILFVLCYLLLVVYDFLCNFITVYTVNKLLFELSIMFSVITSCCYYIESTHQPCMNSLLFLPRFQFCNDIIISLYCGLDFFF